MQKKIVSLIVVLSVMGALLAACSPGNYRQNFAKIRDNYQKTNEIQPLLEALESPDLRVRVLAANYLGEINDPRAVAPLQKALNDPSRYVREEAESALGHYGHAPQTRSVADQDKKALLEGRQVQSAFANADLFSTQLGALPRSRTSVKSLAFSPDGRFMAAGYIYGGYIIWDLKEGHLFAKPIATGHTTPYYHRDRTSVSVQYGDRGKIHAVGDSTAISVRTGNGSILWENTRAHAKSFGRSIGTSIAIVPKFNLLISGGADGAIKTWDLQNGQRRGLLRDGGPAVTSLTVSNHSQMIAFGDQSGRIVVWDLAANRPLRSIKGDSGEINSLAFTPDNRFLVSGGNDGVAKIWDISDGSRLKAFKGHTGSVKSVAVSRNGKLVATGGSRSTIKIWDAYRGRLMKEFNGHSGWVEAIAFSPDGKRIASGGRDGRILLWDIEDRQVKACLVNFDFLDWMVVNPAGYFNTTEDAYRHLWMKIDGRSYSIEPYFQSFYKPEAIRQALSGRTTAPADFTRLDLPPPSIEILKPVDGAVIEKDTVTVSVLTKDSGGGAERMALYHNGRRVHREATRGLQITSVKNESIARFDVKLLAGANTFSAIAFNRAGIQARTKPVTVKHPTTERKVDLHAVVVGINRYRNAELNLNYAVPDATAIASFLKGQVDHHLFKSVSIDTLLDENATAQRIKDALDRAVDNTEPEDVLTLYFCGHGQAVDDQWYFIPHDLLRPERDEEVRHQGISSRALADYLKNARAQKVLLIMDSCKSGAALLAFRGYEDRRALMQLARASGVYIIAASTQNQYAAEVKELGHGVFTHTLLQGLNGKAAMGDQTTVTVKRLLAYVEEQLPLFSQQFKQQPQYPVVYSIGMDFPLTVVK